MRRYESSVEFEHEDHLFVLRGGVMEYFHKAIAWDSRWIHVSPLALHVEPPDRKGRTEFRFQPLDVPLNSI